jgi:hypothetical protein
MWVKLTQGPSSAALLASRSNAFDLIVQTDKTLTWTVKLPRVAQPTVYDSYTVTSEGNALTVGTWHHVAGRFRTTGPAMSVELWLDGFLLGETSVPQERQRNRTATDAICVGSCNPNSPVAAHITLVDVDLVEPAPYFGTETRPTGAGCDPTALPLTLYRDFVRGENSGVQYWYLKDALGTRCQRAHPVILVQGNGQEDQSWYACSETPSGAVIADSQQPGAYETSWAQSPGDCHADFTRRTGTSVWCSDAVEVLTRAGLDVITIDFGEAMADFNSDTPLVPYDKDWMRWSTTEAKCPTCTLREFPQYQNKSEQVKGNDPVRWEFARRGHPLDQAYVLSLLIEYLYYTPTNPTYLRKPIIVGHSMGGLVANIATVSRGWSKVSELPDSEGNPGVLFPDWSANGRYIGRDAYPEIHAVVTLGSPHLGSKLLALGGIIDGEGFSSSNFNDVFAEDPYKEDYWPGNPGDLRPEAWLAFKTPARWGKTPSNSVIGWWAVDYRSKIDDEIDTLPVADVPRHYTVAGMYNAKWQPASGNPAMCRRRPSSEVVRARFGSDSLFASPAYHNQVIEKKAPWHFDWRDRDAEDRECLLCEEVGGLCLPLADFPLKTCFGPKNWRSDCGGNQELPVMFRMLSQQQGHVEWPNMSSINLSDMLNGRFYVQITGGGDEFAWGFNLLQSVIDQTGLDTATDASPLKYSDGAVRVEEALGIDPGNVVDLDTGSAFDGYPEKVRAVVPFGLNDCPAYQEAAPGPFTDHGLYLNHHQLRKGSALHYKICNPNITANCTPVKMITWLRSL